MWEAGSLEPVSCPSCTVGLALQNLGIAFLAGHRPCCLRYEFHTVRLHQLIPFPPMAAPLGSSDVVLGGRSHPFLADAAG